MADVIIDRESELPPPRKKRNFIVSRKSMKILSLFLIPPSILVLLWLAIPLGLHPVTFALVIELYYLWTFFSWITFFDFIWPNCPRRFLLTALTIFLIGSAVLCLILYEGGIWEFKFSFSLCIGVLEALCSMGCYVPHILLVQRRIKRHNQSVTIHADVKEWPTPRVHRHWSRPLYQSLCYWNNLDDIIETELLRKKKADLAKEEAINVTITSVEQITPNQSARSSKQDSDAIEPSATLRLQKFEPWTATTMCWALAFKACMVAVWYYLQGFVIFFQYIQVEATHFSGVLAIIMAALSIIVFTISRIVWINILVGINAKLPNFLESAHFAPFALQITFFLYYRNLFVTFKDWPTTIATNTAVFLLQLILYPVQMLPKVFIFRHKTFPAFLSRYPILKLLAPILEGKITYEQFVMNLSVDYYYDQISEYFSLITFVGYFGLIKHVFSYNLPYYGSFVALTDENFVQLVYRYIYLFGFEVITDFGIRTFTQRYLQINMSKLARNATIYNYRARFLFTVFLCFLLMDVYYSLIDTCNEFAGLPKKAWPGIHQVSPSNMTKTSFYCT
eukprot:TRINITY_DN4454_c0_g1_i1.p1 TRINITY_DN4454_c0_g1~~TRINITY_DN4454_c0_g1_i1.p1  ORF type:complete len:563 (-),score=114.82 TRINITY_DN4454_c0_g1_i1:1-1689(-)